MANLKNIDKVFGLDNGASVTVGNNRAVTRYGDTYHCALHGHVVAQVMLCGADDSLARITLNDCGYLTTTTISAMKDFMRIFGVAGRASRSGGKLSVSYRRADGLWKERDGSPVTILAARYP